MTEQEFYQFVDKADRGEFVGVELEKNAPLNELTGILTQWGTGILCHIAIIEKIIYDNHHKAIDAVVISANGKEVARERLSQYLPKLKYLKFWLLNFYNATTETRGKFVKKAVSRLGVKYNMDIIKELARKSFFCNLWVIGYFVNKWVWTTPPLDKKEKTGTICSKEAVIYVRSVHPDFMKSYWIDYISPAAVFESDEVSAWRP